MTHEGHSDFSIEWQLCIFISIGQSKYLNDLELASN